MAKSIPHLTEMPETLQDESRAALSTTFSVASVGIATLNMLETLLPAAAGEVERESQSLSGHFMTLANYIEANGSQVPHEVTEALHGIVMRMQFQDRNTQVMENTVCILERYRSMLEDVCGNIETMRKSDIAIGQNVSQAVEKILSGIRLSDIRNRYVEALKKAKVHTDGHLSEEVAEPVDGIEFF
jgi:hypothetical protein